MGGRKRVSPGNATLLLPRPELSSRPSPGRRRCCCGGVPLARRLVRWQRHLIVDQRLQRRFDVDPGVDDAGLLQSETCGEDGFTLCRADAAVGELGALLELLVDDGFRQLGYADE